MLYNFGQRIPPKHDQKLLQRSKQVRKQTKKSAMQELALGGLIVIADHVTIFWWKAGRFACLVSEAAGERGKSGSICLIACEHAKRK